MSLALLEAMRRGELRLLARDLPEPSVLSHEILNARPYAFLDDAPQARSSQRRARGFSERLHFRSRPRRRSICATTSASR